jgi:hypothetical protein
MLVPLAMPVDVWSSSLDFSGGQTHRTAHCFVEQRKLASPSWHCKAAEAQPRALKYQGAYRIVAPLGSVWLGSEEVQGHVICTTTLGAAPRRLGSGRYLAAVSRAWGVREVTVAEIVAGRRETETHAWWGRLVGMLLPRKQPRRKNTTATPITCRQDPTSCYLNQS